MLKAKDLEAQKQEVINHLLDRGFQIQRMALDVVEEFDLDNGCWLVRAQCGYYLVMTWVHSGERTVACGPISKIDYRRYLRNAKRHPKVLSRAAQAAYKEMVA